MQLQPSVGTRLRCSCFILSSKFNVFLQKIKVILSTVKNYHIFSLVTGMIFFTAANQGCFYNFGLNFFPKRFKMEHSCLILWYELKHFKSSNWHHSLMSLLARIGLFYMQCHSDDSFKRLSSSQISSSFIKMILETIFSVQTVFAPNIIPT